MTVISQKPGESEQGLAAEIKRLYDKAYPRRTVEFHKDPKDIAEAVDHVVYYHETGRWPKANDVKYRHYSQ